MCKPWLDFEYNLIFKNKMSIIQNCIYVDNIVSKIMMTIAKKIKNVLFQFFEKLQGCEIKAHVNCNIYSW